MRPPRGHPRGAVHTSGGGTRAAGSRSAGGLGGVTAHLTAQAAQLTPGLRARAPGPVRAGQAWSWAPRQRPEPPGPQPPPSGLPVGLRAEVWARPPSLQAPPAHTSLSERQLSSPDGTTSEPPDALCPCPRSRAAPLRTQVPGLVPQPLSREALACSSQPWSLAGSCRETSSALCTDTGRGARGPVAPSSARLCGPVAPHTWRRGGPLLPSL